MHKSGATTPNRAARLRPSFPRRRPSVLASANWPATVSGAEPEGTGRPLSACYNLKFSRAAPISEESRNSGALAKESRPNSRTTMARKALKPVKKSHPKSKTKASRKAKPRSKPARKRPTPKSRAPKRPKAKTALKKPAKKKSAPAKSGRSSKSPSKRAAKSVAKKKPLKKVSKKLSGKTGSHAAGKTSAKPISASAKGIALKAGAMTTKMASKAAAKANGKGGKAAVAAPAAVKPSPGEIAARLSAKRTEKALAEGKVRSGKNGSVELRKLELSPAEAEARKTRLKNLIVLGKERSYLTYAEINDHLPDDILDAEQIEGIISMINDMGIQVYDEAPDAETLLMSEAAPTTAADDVDEEAAEGAGATPA